MTTRPVSPSPKAGNIIQFPDALPEEMTAYQHVLFPGHPGFLALHFGNPESTVIVSEMGAGLFVTEGREGIRYPDLLISFNARPDAVTPRKGYLIPEQGKPPDFVLEVASETTGEVDETDKRRDYARFRVPEYWRFDPTGGDFHSTHLAGDRLVGDEYQTIPIHRTAEGHFRGHSEVLNLDLCWENGELRWYDPVAGRYLVTIPEEREARIAEREARIAEREARIAEREARIVEREARIAAETRADAAEARTRQLEEELRRLRNQ